MKTTAYADSDRSPGEQVTFEYGGLQIRYATQTPDGQPGPVQVAGWNRIKNISDLGDEPLT